MQLCGIEATQNASQPTHNTELDSPNDIDFSQQLVNLDPLTHEGVGSSASQTDDCETNSNSGSSFATQGNVCGLLNGSSSPALTATPHSYGKGQNSTLTKSKTPNGLE